VSTLCLIEQSIAPTIPTSNKVRVFVNTNGNLCSIDDAGNILVYSTGITQEEVEDIVEVIGIIDSPVVGKRGGNKEFLVLLKKKNKSLKKN
jgi:predicted rRNA methylase YqxC with S4 and FtsJ domains